MIEFPPPAIIRLTFFELVRFIQLLSRVPAGRTLQATSWWRDPARNAAVGGAPKSQHLLGLAIDVDGSAQELEEFAERARLVGLVPVREPSHVHLQARPAGYFDSLISV